jgi:hypothetical protein
MFLKFLFSLVLVYTNLAVAEVYFAEKDVLPINMECKLKEKIELPLEELGSFKIDQEDLDSCFSASSLLNLTYYLRTKGYLGNNQNMSFLHFWLISRGYNDLFTGWGHAPCATHWILRHGEVVVENDSLFNYSALLKYGKLFNLNNQTEEMRRNFFTTMTERYPKLVNTSFGQKFISNGLEKDDFFNQLIEIVNSEKRIVKIPPLKIITKSFHGVDDFRKTLINVLEAKKMVGASIEAHALNYSGYKKYACSNGDEKKEFEFVRVNNSYGDQKSGYFLADSFFSESAKQKRIFY